MGIDDDDESGASEDEWQKLLGGKASTDTNEVEGNVDVITSKAVPKAVPGDRNAAEDAKPPRADLLGTRLLADPGASLEGKARGEDGSKISQGHEGLVQGTTLGGSSGFAAAGPAAVDAKLVGVVHSQPPAEKVGTDEMAGMGMAVDLLEEDIFSIEDVVEPVDDAMVVPLHWLDEEENEAPQRKALPPASKAPPEQRARLTAVKSMPFRPAKLLPTDLILEPGVTPPALATEKRPAVSSPDLANAGPPPKAARVDISKPGDLLRHMTSALRKMTVNGEKTHTNDMAVAREPEREVSLTLSDNDGRPYNWKNVVVNFAGIGAAFVRALRGKDPKKEYRVFDWEGVRLCVRHLTLELGLKVIGVTSEGLLGPDKGSTRRLSLPVDIKLMCETIEVADNLSEQHPRYAGRVMTLMVAWQKNCRFISDDIGDRPQQLCNSECQSWLRAARRMLLMRFFFDPRLGRFETPDGDTPAGVIALEAM